MFSIKINLFLPVTANIIRPIAIHTYQKYLNPSGDPVPLNVMLLSGKLSHYSDTSQIVVLLMFLWEPKGRVGVSSVGLFYVQYSKAALL
jgi:hypothetical protein